MAREKIYKCCICHKILDYKPHRLVHQEYQTKRYKQYRNKYNYDFCNRCFKIYLTWINKYREEAK